MLSITINTEVLENLIIETVTKVINEKNLHLLPTEKCAEPENKYISKKEAAKIASVSTSTIDNWRRAREFEPHYFGGSLRIKRNEFMELLESKRLKTSNSY